VNIEGHQHTPVIASNDFIIFPSPSPVNWYRRRYACTVTKERTRILMKNSLIGKIL